MAMSDKMQSVEDMTKIFDGRQEKMSKPKKEEGSLVAKEIEVSGAVEDQLMKM